MHHNYPKQEHEVDLQGIFIWGLTQWKSNSSPSMEPYIYGSILRFVVASAAEAELGALFLNCKEGKVIRVVLQELGHPQPPTPVHCDNQTTVGIANETVKKQRSRSMEMRFVGVTDQVKRSHFNMRLHY